MMELKGIISDRLRKLFPGKNVVWYPQRGEEPYHPLPADVHGEHLQGRKPQ